MRRQHCHSVLPYIADKCAFIAHNATAAVTHLNMLSAVCCSVFQCAAVCCSVLPVCCGAMFIVEIVFFISNNAAAAATPLHVLSA